MPYIGFKVGFAMKLFVSYSRQDVEFAKTLANDLSQAGFDIWIDLDDIPAGRKWSSAIQQGLDAAQIMILIISPDSMASTNVEDEWQYFLDERKLIVPVRLKPAKIHFQLKRLQFVDFHEKQYQAAYSDLCAKLNAERTLSSLDILPKPFEWVDIPMGKVVLKGGGYVPKGGHSFNVPAFAIAKYPLTNAQFAKFVEADGYNQRQWWSVEGWQARESNSWVEPGWWSAVPVRLANCPVIGISWFEAVAFCLWLSDATGEKVALPTEQQWQRAAQGNTNRAYPWGDNFDENCCNFNRKGTTPVTQYEGKGNSPFGVVDMSGNVWEWCLTDYESGEQNVNAFAIKRVLRGGSWYSNAVLNVRSDFRDWNLPDKRSDVWGFRLVRS